MASILLELVATPAAEVPPDPTPDELEELSIAEVEMTSDDSNERDGTPSVFACPDCHGTLWEAREGDLLRFRCRVGHAWSPDSLVVSHDESTERALWAATRALEESAALAHRMAATARLRNSKKMAVRYDERALEMEQNTALVRELLFKYTHAYREQQIQEGGIKGDE
jgi:two-component system chemotaxis response regulator CheB